MGGGGQIPEMFRGLRTWQLIRLARSCQRCLSDFWHEQLCTVLFAEKETFDQEQGWAREIDCSLDILALTCQ